jgi:hypothetical protein
VIPDHDADNRLIAIAVLDASTRVADTNTVPPQVIPGAEQPAAAERPLSRSPGREPDCGAGRASKPHGYGCQARIGSVSG